jgi:hypothetical protein
VQEVVEDHGPDTLAAETVAPKGPSAQFALATRPIAA